MIQVKKKNIRIVRYIIKKTNKVEKSLIDEGIESCETTYFLEPACSGSCCTICFEPWSNSGDHRYRQLTRQ